MTTVTVDHERTRHEAIVARRLAIAMERDPAALPIVVVQPPTQPPSNALPADDKPGFGTGVITALVLVGVFVLGWQVVTRMDTTNLAFLAGAMLAFGAVFLGLLVAAWIGDHSR